MLGRDVVAELNQRGDTAIGFSSRELDVTDAAACQRRLAETAPDGVIHCAAWTAVDAAEDAENYARVYAVNVDGARNVADACERLGCKMLYVSTEYVFDGSGERPWKPDCTDFHPLNVYGRTKLLGEQAVAESLTRRFIVRTSWLYGEHGGSFVAAILNRVRNRDSLRVVNDQVGIPTYTVDLARLLVDMIATERYGTYHATNAGAYVNRYDLARAIARHAYLPADLTPVSSDDYGFSKAARPLNSRLDTGALEAAGFRPLPDWEDALERYLRRCGGENAAK